MAIKDNAEFMQIDKELFSRRLVQTCYDSGSSQARLAEATGIDPGILSRYMSGKKVPNLKTIYAIAKYLGVSIDYLVGNDEAVLEKLGELRDMFVHERGDKARRVLDLLDEVYKYYSGARF